MCGLRWPRANRVSDIYPLRSALPISGSAVASRLCDEAHWFKTSLVTPKRGCKLVLMMTKNELRKQNSEMMSNQICLWLHSFLLAGQANFVDKRKGGVGAIIYENAADVDQLFCDSQCHPFKISNSRFGHFLFGRLYNLVISYEYACSLRRIRNLISI